MPNTQIKTASQNKNIIRDIIEIDQSLCDGCGQCISSCAEGALELHEGKIRLKSDSYCDGLGACLGRCPTGALTIIRRSSQNFDPTLASDQTAHESACPGQAPIKLAPGPAEAKEQSGSQGLASWPIQIKLVQPMAPFLETETLILAADCTAFAYRDFAESFLSSNHPLLVGCPKLDSADFYINRLADILTAHPSIKEIRLVLMSVPCCRGLAYILDGAKIKASKNLLIRTFVITPDGTLEEEHF